MWRYQVFDSSRDHAVDVLRDFVGGAPLFPAKFKPCGSADNGVCNLSSNSSSNFEVYKLSQKLS